MSTLAKPGMKPVRKLTITALLGAVAAILMYMQIPLPFAPPFYKIDFADVPCLIGAFALGPAAGAQVAVIKVLLKLVLRGTDTAFLGDAVNLIGTIILVLPAALIYRKDSSRKGLRKAVLISAVIHVIWSCLCNYFISLPMYAAIYGWPMERLIGMGTAVNPNITDMRTFILMAVLPFNLLKNALVSVITIYLSTWGQFMRLIEGTHKQEQGGDAACGSTGI